MTAFLPHSSRQAWIDVDLTALESNVRALHHAVGPDVEVIGVVKANGYGHGMLVAARALCAGGATRLAVSTTAEGSLLRAAGIQAPIIVIGYTPPEHIADALRDNLALMIGDAATLQTAAQIGAVSGRPIRVHVKVDTGMSRLGLLPHELGAFLDSARSLDGISWEGLFTHFATADEPWRPELARQVHCFEEVLSSVCAAGWRFPLIHAANSAAALWHPQTRYNAVRTGIALYGVSPSDELALPNTFRPALAFRTHVVRVADLPPGSPVSYGARYVTTGPQRIATIAAGYADGLRRAPAWLEVLVRGQRAPIVGRICMDYAMIDVSTIADVAVGDEVTLLGAQGGEQISAHEVARWLGTSAYEVLTSVGK